jgi:hypothetical protein
MHYDRFVSCGAFAATGDLWCAGERDIHGDREPHADGACIGGQAEVVDASAEAYACVEIVRREAQQTQASCLRSGGS